jgi:hypothetical protein
MYTRSRIFLYSSHTFACNICMCNIYTYICMYVCTSMNSFEHLLVMHVLDNTCIYVLIHVCMLKYTCHSRRVCKFTYTCTYLSQHSGSNNQATLDLFTWKSHISNLNDSLCRANTRHRTQVCHHVCIYMCIYMIYMYICMYIYIYIYIYHMYTCIHTYKCCTQHTHTSACRMS